MKVDRPSFWYHNDVNIVILQHIFMMASEYSQMRPDVEPKEAFIVFCPFLGGEMLYHYVWRQCNVLSLGGVRICSRSIDRSQNSQHICWPRFRVPHLLLMSPELELKIHSNVQFAICTINTTLFESSCPKEFDGAQLGCSSTLVTHQDRAVH